MTLLIAAFAMRLVHLDAQSLWWDEMVTVFRSASPPSLMWADILRARNQVPLYYVLMRPWATLGQRAFWVRYISVWWGMVEIALTYRLGARLANQSVGTLAAGLLSALPTHVWYSQEARAYTLLGALAVLSYLQLLRLARRPRDGWGWLGYGATLTAILYTHYFGAFLLLAQAIPLLLQWRRNRPLFLRWAVTAGLVGLAFLPWLAIVLRAGGFRQAPIDWIADAHWYEPLLTFYTFGLGSTADPARWWNWLAALALLVSFGWGARRLLRQAGSALVSQTVLCWAGVPLFLMWILSVNLPGLPQRRSIYMDRYITWLLPPFALLVAWGWQRWRRRHRSAWIAALPVLACLALSLGALYVDPRHAREDWRSAVASLNQLATHDAVLVSDPVQRLPLWYYPPSEELTVVEAPQGPPEGNVNEWLGIPAPIPELWLITWRDNTNPHGFPAQRNQALAGGATFDQRKNWLDTHYHVAQRLSFPGIILSCYRQAGTAHDG